MEAIFNMLNHIVQMSGKNKKEFASIYVFFLYTLKVTYIERNPSLLSPPFLI